MKRLLVPALCVISALALSACALVPSPNDPLKDGQYASFVNSLSWTNPMSGKRDGLRSSWPLKTLAGHEESFPLGQVKHCEPAGGACSWGVLSAQRKVGKFRYLPDGVSVDVTLELDVDRRQEAHRPGYDAVMAIPSDIPSLRLQKKVQRTLTLQYGKVEHLDFDYGLRFDVCVLRYDVNGRALDTCDIPHI